MDNRRTIKAVINENTICSCEDSETLSDDGTGMPRNPIAVQSDGFVRLSFTDDSVCEEAYVFSRQLVKKASLSVTGEALVAFTSNFFFYSPQPCASEEIKPDDDYSDKVSDLVVGYSYKYCISAVAKDYMVDTNVKDGSFVRSSKSSCVTHEIKWVSFLPTHNTLVK